MARDLAVGELLGPLQTAPARIASATKAATDAEVNLRSAVEPWSVNDILAHLRACQDVRNKLVHEMLTRDHPTIRYVSPRTYIRKTNYPELPFRTSLAAFAADREAFVQALRSLEPEQWKRGADLKGRRFETVLNCAEYLVAHEAVHLDQIDALMVAGRS